MNDKSYMKLSGAWKKKLRISKTFNCLFDLTVINLKKNHKQIWTRQQQNLERIQHNLRGVFALTLLAVSKSENKCKTDEKGWDSVEGGENI